MAASSALADASRLEGEATASATASYEATDAVAEAVKSKEVAWSNGQAVGQAAETEYYRNLSVGIENGSSSSQSDAALYATYLAKYDKANEPYVAASDVLVAAVQSEEAAQVLELVDGAFAAAAQNAAEASQTLAIRVSIGLGIFAVLMVVTAVLFQTSALKAQAVFAASLDQDSPDTSSESVNGPE